MVNRVWTTDELVRHLFPSTFIIDPIFPRGGVALMYGKRGIGKSLYVMTLAVCMTEGGVLFGRYRTRKGPVVWVSADMGAPLVQERIRKTKRSYHLEGIHYVFPDFLSIPTLSASDDFVKKIQEVKPELIIWDTLRQSHQLDMNSGETTAMVYGTVKHLFPGVAHTFIHHEKKTIPEQEMLDSDETFSGNSAWIDAADLGLRLREIAPGKLSLDFTKVRTAPPQGSIALSLNTENMLLYAMGEQPQTLMARWREQNPRGTPEQLERFLLSCFVAPPRTIKVLMGGCGVGTGVLTGAVHSSGAGKSPTPAPPIITQEGSNGSAHPHERQQWLGADVHGLPAVAVSEQQREVPQDRAGTHRQQGEVGVGGEEREVGLHPRAVHPAAAGSRL